MKKKVIFEDLGRIRYKSAWDYQEKLFEQVISEKLNKNEKKDQYLLFFVNMSMSIHLEKEVINIIYL